jgi:YbgC/YbaW family acyl-CoA thioester hydrolase
MISKTKCDVTKRVYLAETDSGGVVYFSNLCNYLEMGCAEFFRMNIMPFKDILELYSVFFVMRKVELEYLKFIKYDDVITISTNIVKAKRFSISFNTCVNIGGETCYKAKNQMVPVNINTKNPVIIPEKVFKRISELNEKCID